MLAQLLDTMKPERLQHDQKQAQAKSRILRRCQELYNELQHHPERADHLQAVIEKAEAELRKYGGN